MSGALVGFRIDDEVKLTRLHGERRAELVLREMVGYLIATPAARMVSYAQRLKVISPAAAHLPSEADRQALESFCTQHFEESCTPRSWPEVFALLPEFEAWHAGFPYLPDAVLDTCGDVSWAFLIDLDRGQLQIHVNRHAHFHWREIAVRNSQQAPYCTVDLEHARRLTSDDLGALHGLLHNHSYSDGIDPILPARDGTSPSSPSVGAFEARVRLHRGLVQLLLERDGLKVEVRQMGELRLDDRHQGHFLREALERDVLGMALAIYGPGASLSRVACVAARLDSLPFTSKDTALPLLDLGLRPAFGLALQLGPHYFDSLRATFIEAGMSPQGWRFLVKQDDEVLRFLLHFFPPSRRNLGEFAHFINLLATALQTEALRIERCQPALRGVERILERTRGRPGPLREENARIYLRALMRARLSPEDEANLAHDAQDVSDFVYAHAAVLKDASWKTLDRRSAEWHQALLISSDPAKDVSWPALLPSHSAGEFVAVELDSGRLLAEEGLQQRHCIGNYANACLSGSTRVFSIRKNGKRVATLELHRERSGEWQASQMRGKANAVIRDQVLLDMANELALEYTQIARRKRAESEIQPAAISAAGV